jgi:hypothetical protein
MQLKKETEKRSMEVTRLTNAPDRSRKKVQGQVLYDFDGI